ncbi:hypothetical protein ABBQ32_003793 [Trebouxia sp. C0010 RCD-2024]
MPGWQDVRAAESTPTDRGHLSSLWRQSKLVEFERRLATLDCSKDGQAAALLQTLQSETAAANDLQATQQRQVLLYSVCLYLLGPQDQICSSNVVLQGTCIPWWADGEYNDTEADRANDMGVQAFKTKRYEHAFQLYTEAIRLCPRKAAYHCNRAAAALKLHQFAVAIEDARNVLKRDSSSIKAYTRAGSAHLGLGQPEAAAAMFKQALQLDATYSAAQRGLVTALRAEGRAVAAALQEQSAALSSDRAGLTREAVEAEQATELLLTAEGMLSAQPESHAVSCSHVEALIACRRYPDAAIAANKLHAGQDKLCLQAQVLWRQADLDAAARLLSEAREQFPDSSKCLELQRWVESLQQEVHQASIAFEDGLLDHAASKYTQLLASLQPGACSGLYAWLLLKKAATLCQKRDYNAALQSLNMALEWEPENAECLQLRAEVWRSQVTACLGFHHFAAARLSHDRMHCWPVFSIGRDWACRYIVLLATLRRASWTING